MPVIPSEYYFNESGFNEEYEKVFLKSWLFAGLTTELANNKDFTTFEVCGEPVVLQNFEGTIKAFQNVCSHRFNKIQWEIFGNRPLLCNYHYWSFDKEGFPRSIPKKEGFSFTESELKCLKLKEYKVGVCGIFVFIQMEDDGTSLQDYLGSFYERLQETSNYLGDKTHTEDILHNANWKLLVENVLECYHCAAVHSDSFFKMGYGQRAAENIIFENTHSVCDFPKAEVQAKSVKRNNLIKYLDNRPLKHNSYKHLFIFPNFFMSSTEGITFYIGQLLPKTAVASTLRVRNFDTALEPEKKESAVHKAFSESSVAISQQLLYEDKAVIENVQVGITYAKRNQLFGKDEVRIQHFHERVMDMLSGKQL